MKNLILLLSILSNTLCSAQSFGDHNAVWVYNYIGGTSEGVTIVEYNRDTIFMDEKVKIFTKRLLREFGNGERAEFVGRPVYIIDKNNIVQYSVDLINFDTLYNFNTQVNESWSLPKRDFNGNRTGEFLVRKVVSKFDQIINGVNVPCLGVINNDDPVLDTICTRIGSTLYYIQPFDYQDIDSDGGEGGSLRCFSDDILGVLERIDPYANDGGSFSDFEYDCDQLSNTTLLAATNSDILIHPNPVSDWLTIHSNDQPIVNIKIYNAYGQLQYQSMSEKNKVELDITVLPSGLYFVIINDRYNEKIVVIE